MTEREEWKLIEAVQARRKYREGYSIEDIAFSFGRQTNIDDVYLAVLPVIQERFDEGVRRWQTLHGRQPTPPCGSRQPKPFEDKVAALWAEEFPDWMIASRMGMPYAVVQEITAPLYRAKFGRP